MIDQAVQLLAAVDGFHKATHTEIAVTFGENYQHYLERVQVLLSEGAFRGWDEGRQMTMDDPLAQALTIPLPLCNQLSTTSWRQTAWRWKRATLSRP